MRALGVCERRALSATVGPDFEEKGKFTLRIHKGLSTVITLLILAFWLIPSTGARKLAASKPKIAVLQFKNKANNQWWNRGGAESAQDVFITELSKSGKFDVLKREDLEELMQEKNLSLSGDVDPTTAVKVGKLLGVNYLLTGAVTQYGIVGREGGGGLSAGTSPFVAAMNGRLIDTSTGKVVWSDEERNQADSPKVSVFGVGGGANDARMFDQVMKPVIQKLVASLLNSASATSPEPEATPATNTGIPGGTVNSVALRKVLLTKQVLIGGCENTTGNVYLAGPAGPGGVTVNLSTTGLAGVTVPASVFIPAGQTVSPAFSVTTSTLTTKQVGTINATSGTAVSRGLTINVGSGVCP